MSCFGPNIKNAGCGECDLQWKIFNFFFSSFPALTLSYDVALNGKFNYSFNLDPNNCNIYFIQIKDGEEWSEINVVYKGRLQSSRSRGWICGELTLIDPCHISIQDFELSCNGRYKVKDLKNNLVYSVELIAICEFPLC